MSALRQAIRASTSSPAVAGVKRPAEALQWVIRMTDCGKLENELMYRAPRPQLARMSVAQQQQQSVATVGGREILGDLPVEGADVKRMKC
jgi:hypothetical protein